MRAVLIERVEKLVEQHNATIELPANLLEIVERRLREDLTAYYAEARSEHARLERQRIRLQGERASCSGLITSQLALPPPE